MLELKQVTQEQLKQFAQQGNAVRVGATNDPHRRAGEYSREGYRGTMYYASTQNMQRAEDNLLASCKAKHACAENFQRSSNAKAEPGYVYVILE